MSLTECKVVKSQRAKLGAAPHFKRYPLSLLFVVIRSRVLRKTICIEKSLKIFMKIDMLAWCFKYHVAPVPNRVVEITGEENVAVSGGSGG